jgi:hypothetical protein
MCSGIPVDSDLFQFALRAYVRQKYFPLLGRKIDLFDEEGGLEKLRGEIDKAARRLFSYAPAREAA